MQKKKITFIIEDLFISEREKKQTSIMKLVVFKNNKGQSCVLMDHILYVCSHDSKENLIVLLRFSHVLLPQEVLNQYAYYDLFILVCTRV